MVNTDASNDMKTLRQKHLRDEMALFDKMVSNLEERLDESQRLWHNRDAPGDGDKSSDQLSATRSTMAIMKQCLQIFKARRDSWKELASLEKTVESAVVEPCAGEPATIETPVEFAETDIEAVVEDKKMTDPKWMATATDEELIEIFGNLEPGKKPPFLFKRAAAFHHIRRRKLPPELTLKVADALDDVPPSRYHPQFLVSSVSSDDYDPTYQ